MTNQSSSNQTQAFDAISENSHNLKCIVYLRTATSLELGGDGSIQTQDLAIKKRAEENEQFGNMEIVATFTDDGISGSNTSRPWFDKAIAYLQEQNKDIVKVGYFLCTEISKISRPKNIGEGMEMIEKIRKTGACVVSTNENIILKPENEAESTLIASIKFAIAKYEKDCLCARVRNGKLARLHRQTNKDILPVQSSDTEETTWSHA